MTQIINRSGQPNSNEATSRQRLYQRYDGHIRRALARRLGQGNPEGLGKEGLDITVPKRDIEEASIHHGKGGVHQRVLPGNKKYVAGDRIGKPGGGSASNKSGQQASEGEGEDDFQFHISKEDIMKYLFDGLALPNMTKVSAGSVKQTKPKRAGFVAQGPFDKVDLVRSKQKKLGRTIAAAKPYNMKILTLLEEERDILTGMTSPSRPFRENANDDASGPFVPTALRISTLAEQVNMLKAGAPQLSERGVSRVLEIESEIRELDARKHGIPSWNESTDLSFRNHVQEPIPNARAVVVYLMDVSGSMGEEEKSKARMFHFLVHTFLEMQYGKGQVDEVFITHTETAKQVSEEVFFYGRESGGTRVSAGIREVQGVMKSYAEKDPKINIYGVQVSDGDNINVDDTITCIDMLTDMMKMSQAFFYMQVKSNYGSGDLLDDYSTLKRQFPNKFLTGQVEEQNEVWPLFRKFFQKKSDGPVMGPRPPQP